jgi:hypothetical protein
MHRWTRRSVVGAGAALAIGGPALAQQGGQPLRVRRDVSRMAQNDPDLLALAAAMRIMQSNSDALSWENQVQIHAGNSVRSSPGVGNQHTNWRFLPWHRCQLYWFEAIVARLSGKADFAMPYWDWQASGRLPPVFTSPSGAFYHARRNPGLASFDFVANRTSLNLGPPADVFRGSFYSVVGFPPTPDEGYAGLIESSGHAYAHIMIGGDMNDITVAPRDPVFWFHHCNIDRVWATWQANAADRGEVADQDWLDQTFDGFVDASGGLARIMTTPELVNTPDLGYRYDANYPMPFFDERPPVPPAGKTKRVVLSNQPHSLRLAMEPGVHAPLRLPLPDDLVAALAADKDGNLQVKGTGKVRSTDPMLNGSVIEIAIERIRKDGTLDLAPMTAMMPFVGHHGAPAAPASPAPATATPATSTPAMPPAPAMPAALPVHAMPMPAMPAAKPHQHGFGFTLGPQLYDATGKDAATEIAVIATTRWIAPPADPAPPPPSLSGLDIDLVVTEMGWV